MSADQDSAGGKMAEVQENKGIGSLGVNAEGSIVIVGGASQGGKDGDAGESSENSLVIIDELPSSKHGAEGRTTEGIQDGAARDENQDEGFEDLKTERDPGAGGVGREGGQATETSRSDGEEATESMEVIDENEVKGEGQIQSLDTLPTSDNSKVKDIQDHLKETIMLLQVINILSIVGRYLRITCNATADDAELVIGQQEALFETLKLCDSLSLMMQSLQSGANNILEKLKIAYLYLLDGFPDFATADIAAISKDVDSMKTAVGKMQARVSVTVDKVKGTKPKVDSVLADRETNLRKAEDNLAKLMDWEEKTATPVAAKQGPSGISKRLERSKRDVLSKFALVWCWLTKLLTSAAVTVYGLLVALKNFFVRGVKRVLATLYDVATLLFLALVFVARGLLAIGSYCICFPPLILLFCFLLECAVKFSVWISFGSLRVLRAVFVIFPVAVITWAVTKLCGLWPISTLRPKVLSLLTAAEKTTSIPPNKQVTEGILKFIGVNGRKRKIEAESGLSRTYNARPQASDDSLSLRRRHTPVPSDVEEGTTAEVVEAAAPKSAEKPGQTAHPPATRPPRPDSPEIRGMEVNVEKYREAICRVKLVSTIVDLTEPLLGSLEGILLKSSKLVETWYDECVNVVEPSMTMTVKAAEKLDQEGKMKYWNSMQFQQEVIKYYCRWRALQVYAEKNRSILRKVRQQIEDYYTENLRPREAVKFSWTLAEKEEDTKIQEMCQCFQRRMAKDDVKEWGEVASGLHLV